MHHELHECVWIFSSMCATLFADITIGVIPRILGYLSILWRIVIQNGRHHFCTVIEIFLSNIGSVQYVNTQQLKSQFPTSSVDIEWGGGGGVGRGSCKGISGNLRNL